ncbi:MAG: phosphodiester glycosidase family protein [Bacteroidota bacterium]
MKYLMILFIALSSIGCKAQDATEQASVADTAAATVVQTTPLDPVDSLQQKLKQATRQLEEQEGFLDSLNTVLSRSKKREKVTNGELRYYKRNIQNLIKYNKCFGWRVEFLGKTYDTYVVDIDAVNLKLYHKDKNGKHYTFKRMSNEVQANGGDLAFAMNAGMFTPERNPQGLYIEGGRQQYKMNMVKNAHGNFFMQFRKNDPNMGVSNGVFVISQERGAGVVFPDSIKHYDRKKIVLATQSGPLMLKDGVFNEHFNQGSPNKFIRNGVGIINDRKVVFAISNEPVNFYEFTQLFKEFFECSDALYLDGAISQIYAPELGNIHSLGNGFGPILGVIR